MQFFEIRAKHHFKRKKLKPNKDLILKQYNVTQAAEYLGLTTSMMWRFRNVMGGGPKYTGDEENHNVRYTKQALDIWAQENSK